MNKLTSLFSRRPECIGLNIEGGWARMARINRNSDGHFELMAIGEAKLSLESKNEKDHMPFLLEFRRVSAGNTKVAVNVEDESLRIRRMVFPKMPESDLLEAIRWNFREHISGSIDDYVVGYTPTEGVVDGNKHAITAYGISQEAIDRYSEFLSSLGLKPLIVEPAASSLLAAFANTSLLDEKKYRVCISFNERYSYFIVFRHRELLFSRPLAGFSQENLIKQLMRDTGVDDEDVTLLLKDWMAKGVLTKDDVNVSVEALNMFYATIKHVYSQLVVEVQRSIDAFCILCDVERIDSIHVCGIGVYYPKMLDHIQRTLGVDTVIFDSFESIYNADYFNDNNEGLRQLGPMYAIAVGLAMP